MKYFLIAIVLAIVGFLLLQPQPVERGPGVLAPEEPRQTRLIGASTLHNGDYTMTPLAEFDITARVLSRKDYMLGREAEISPTDLALGWGPMSDTSVLEKIKISQNGRWYRWQVKEWPIPRREIERNSANMHIIPAAPSVERTLKEIREGHVVTIRGKLVKVEASDGWHWKSSLTRNDTGDGGCELILVEQLSYQGVGGTAGEAQ